MGVGRVVMAALLLDEERVDVVAWMGLIEREAMRSNLLHEERAHVVIPFEGTVDAKHVERHAIKKPVFIIQWKSNLLKYSL